MAICAAAIEACNKETPADNPFDGYHVATKVDIVIMDKDSTDLLNPDINKFEMALYKDAEMKEKRPECLVIDTLPKFWNMVDTIARHYMYFYAPLDYSKEIPEESKKIWYSTSYLSIDGITVDTIRTEVVEMDYSLTLKKVFYNGEDIDIRTGVVVK